MATNPVFDRIEKDAQRGYAGFNAPGQVGTETRPSTGQAGAQWGAQSAMSQRQLNDLYNSRPRVRSRPAGSPWTTS